MIFYKEPFVLNENIENKDIKTIIKIFKGGNFYKANKMLSILKPENLSELDKKEYNKLKTMLSIDKAGIFAVLFLFTVIIFLFIDYIGN